MLMMLWYSWLFCGVCVGLYHAFTAFVDCAVNVYLLVMGEN